MHFGEQLLVLVEVKQVKQPQLEQQTSMKDQGCLLVVVDFGLAGSQSEELGQFEEPNEAEEQILAEKQNQDEEQDQGEEQSQDEGRSLGGYQSLGEYQSQDEQNLYLWEYILVQFVDEATTNGQMMAKLGKSIPWNYAVSVMSSQQLVAPASMILVSQDMFKLLKQPTAIYRRNHFYYSLFTIELVTTQAWPSQCKFKVKQLNNVEVYIRSQRKSFPDKLHQQIIVKCH